MNFVAAHRKLVDRERGRMRPSVRASLAAVAGVLVALTSVAAPMASGAAASTAVPFVGAFRGTETNTVAPPFETVDSVGHWTGVATHLGWFKVESPHTVALKDMTATGTFEFTAANGDTLTADFYGQAVVHGESQRAFHRGTRDDHRGDGSLRRGHRGVHRPTPVGPGHHLDHRLLHGDDLVALNRVSREGLCARTQPLPLGVRADPSRRSRVPTGGGERGRAS